MTKETVLRSYMVLGGLFILSQGLWMIELSMVIISVVALALKPTEKKTDLKNDILPQ